MTRPFTPRDAFRVRDQQATGAALELEAVVLVGRSPLRQAFAGYWPLDTGGVETFVLGPTKGSIGGGFVQARRRLDDTEADLTFISPGLDVANGAALCWQRVIADACQQLGARGTQRIYAAIDEDDRVALQVLRQLGFVVYTSDLVFRRPPDAPPVEPPGGMTVVSAGPGTTPAIERIIRHGLPQSLRAKEGAPDADWTRYPLGGRAPGPVATRAWLDDRGDVMGAWRLVAGRSGHWLRVAADQDAEAGPPVQWAVAEAGRREQFPPLPIYTAARGYEPGLNLALRESGFEPLLGRFRLVKHTTVRIMEPAWRRRAIREGGLDPAPTRTTTLSESVRSVSYPSHHRS